MIHKPFIQKTFLFIAGLFWLAIFILLLNAGLAAAPEHPLLAGLIGLVFVGLASCLVHLSLK